MLRSLKSKGVRNIALALDDALRSDDFAAAAVEGAILADLEPDRYKTDPKKNEKQVDSFSVLGGFAGRAGSGPHPRRSAKLHPRTGQRARQCSHSHCAWPKRAPDGRRVWPGVRSSGAGPHAPARHGRSAGRRARQRRTARVDHPALSARNARLLPRIISGLVGKGVTFDTGGISIKPADGMEKMRYDMAGGAAVLGAMRAIAQLKPSIPVTALIPTVENMPGSKAQRPGDIVTSLSGKTVEVLNTDAEGRLILIDALTYAQRLGCTHLVDAATLTGSIVVALGHREHRSVHQQPAVPREADRRRQSRRRKDVANAHGRGIQGSSQERFRGPAQHRRPSGRVGHGRLVHRRISSAIRPGSIWISRARPGWTTPSLSWRKARRESASEPL